MVREQTVRATPESKYIKVCYINGCSFRHGLTHHIEIFLWNLNYPATQYSVTKEVTESAEAHVTLYIHNILYPITVKTNTIAIIDTVFVETKYQIKYSNGQTDL